MKSSAAEHPFRFVLKFVNAVASSRYSNKHPKCVARQPLVGVLSLLRLRGIFLEPFCHISIKIGVTSFMTRWPQYFGRLITVPCQLVSLASSCHSSSGNVFSHLGNMHAA